MQVDLHMHSSCSDGTLSPAQVMERARQQGLEIAALTDHDTLAGIAAAGETCGGVKLLTGLEITCAEQLWPGMDQPLSIHLLGYGFDPGTRLSPVCWKSGTGRWKRCGSSWPRVWNSWAGTCLPNRCPGPAA